MERNFFRRIEIAFPVLDAKLKRRILKEGLHPYLLDNCQAWEMDSEGAYHLKASKRGRSNAQEQLLADLTES
jgi:polyphosphate kinase